MTALRRCCVHCMAREGVLVIAAGALGMVGFVVAGSALGFGWIGLDAYFILAFGSLSLYVLSLVVGQLGAPRTGEEWRASPSA